MKFIFILTLAANIAIIASAAIASEQLDGCISPDRETMTISSSGIAIIDLKNHSPKELASIVSSATNRAKEQLIESVLGMNLDWQRSADDTMAGEYAYDRIPAAIDSLIVLAKPYRIYNDTLIIQADLILKDDLSEVVFHDSIVATTCSLEDIYLRKASPLYTGLLIDCRGLNLNSVRQPRILSREGEEIFPGHFSRGDTILNKGAVGYVRSAYCSAGITGENPLFIKGINVSGKYNCDAVIDDSDASYIVDSLAKKIFSANCRITFIIGEGEIP
jgi:hypothetical protein